MSTTKDQIIIIADALIRDKGYNAFSFFDISTAVGIKKASIHYHFPQKIDVCLAVLDYHTSEILRLIAEHKDKTALEKLDRFLAIYSKLRDEHKICIVGSLSTDYNTLDIKIKDSLKAFSDKMIAWVSAFLEEGRTSQQFAFSGDARTKAMLTITNMVASLQLSRLTEEDDFKRIQQAIREELLKEN